MDSGKFDENREYQRVLDPEVRLKLITKNSNTVEIDANIPPRRYYKSGLEMVRMANVYLDEGSLENAFILYMKFMTLFIEKIRTHPEFDKVPSTVKAINYQKLKEVLPKAEELKSKLLEQYKREYERFQMDMHRREALANERKQLLQEERERAESMRGTISTLPEPKIAKTSKYNITPVPPLLDALYPNDAVTTIPEKPEYTRAQPSVNRCTKPSSLLSPNSHAQSKLRSVIIPGNLMREFLQKAQKNTDRNIETCAILAGNLRKNQLVVTHLLIPEQTGTCDSCTTQREEELFDFQDQNDLITFGWIHTHPTQTAFLSSVDLHTHCSYQRMMPEAIAIVCAPRYSDNSFFCLTPDYGLDFIANCQQQGFHPHPTEPELYTIAKHCEIDPSTLVKVIDLRR
ncbi:STAM-binding protein-like [Halyomorpha halys]|uniref:STAM-binding protein-like n=1 Tax=Halyomorpha halys TaxID=286706 RepID=UPI0006D50DEC|nr:STAM-binding protein-like [Halyomorpha halys]